MHNVLNDPGFRVRVAGVQVQQLSLPGVLAALSRSTIEAFLALMPHQKQAWFTFLVQLAAIGLHRAGRLSPANHEGEWRALLRGLTPRFSADEPWCLVVKDLRKPGFFQPPVPEGSLSEFKGPFSFPDVIGVLVTSKNHDLKMTRIRQPGPEHWAYALVALQTMEGFLGQGNYGISRMNGGFASRPCVGVVQGSDWGTRFRRDIRVLLEERDRVLNQFDYYMAAGGLALLWLEPWDGKSPLSLEQLDPYYIEICRRVRLTAAEGRLVGWTRPTKARRLAAEDQKGNVGDPWIPVKKGEPSSLTVSRRGFTYDLFQQVLFSAEYTPSPCQSIRPDDPEEGNDLLALAMARGKGKTDGLHERRVPIPRKARSVLMLTEGRDRLATLARQRVEDAATLERKALRPALLALVQGGQDKLDFRDGRPSKWLSEFDRSVDEAFFPALWDALDMDDDEARRRWQRRLVQMGEEVLREAERSLPVPIGRRFKAVAVAERVYFGSATNVFPLLRNKEGSDDSGSGGRS